jgi:mono/diheme cytochrome c family protein
MRYFSATVLFAACFLMSAIPAEVGAQTGVEPDRGELLYTTHCVACHNARVHWRDKRLATNWKSLRAQVRRWQGVQKLRWKEEDIAEVARYLNTFYYNFPSPEG